MQARYTPQEMLALLAYCGFAVREVWDAEAMTRRFFTAHNRGNPDPPWPRRQACSTCSPCGSEPPQSR